MKTVSKKEFEQMVKDDAKQLQGEYKRMGSYWPLKLLKVSVREQLQRELIIK